MISEAETQRRWPLAWMLILFVAVFFFWVLAEPEYVSTHSVFTEPMGLGIFAIYLGRTLLAAIRKEKNRDWIYYMAFLVGGLIALEAIVICFVPLAYPGFPYQGLK